MLKSDGFVFFVRNCGKEAEELAQMHPNLSTNKSRSRILGMMRYLRHKKRLGLVHQWSNVYETLMVHIMPPSFEIMQLLNIPWRFRRLIGRYSRLVDFGKKAHDAEVEKIGTSKT